MKKFKRIVSVVLTILTCLSTTLGMSCNNRESVISLPDAKVGSNTEIALKSYSGTVYGWSFEIEPSEGLVFISSEFVSQNDDPNWVGGGEIVYKFKALTTGNYTIKFSAKDITRQNDLPIEIIIYKLTIK